MTMNMCVNRVWCTVLLLCLVQVCISQVALRGPPRVEKVTMLTDSYIPAAIQIIAHVTELMKYDLRPTTTQPPYGPTTTSTLRPTPPHKPAIVAPTKPLGATFYFANQKELAYKDYIERLKQPSGLNYFDRYNHFLDNLDPADFDARARSLGIDSRENIATYFGRNFADLLLLANRLEPVVAPNDSDEQVQEFSKLYDDSDIRSLLLRQKQNPPTKAYVTLLSLYDLLNKESKRQGLNKYQGYHEGILKLLYDNSQGTSADQLHFVLSKLNEDTKKPDIQKKVKQLMTDLEESNSYINLALRYIPPLAFTL